MTKNRVELFSDGVFAIVLTLLVLDLRVPASHGVTGLVEIAPALLVHAATFFMVGVLWHIHHGGFARVLEITTRTLLLNLLALFWVTLLPFAAKNAAERPFEPLGSSLMAAICGSFLLTMIAVRLSAHSTIDDNPIMRRWRKGRLALGVSVGLANLGCAGLAWAAPWIGYVCVLATILLLLLLPSPGDAERKLVEQAA